MAKFVLKDAKIAWDGDDISGVSNNAVVTRGINTEVANGFGDDTEINCGTIRTNSAAVSGFYVPSVIDAAVDVHQLNPKLKDLLMITPKGEVLGQVAYLMQVTPADHTQGGDFGDLAKFSLAFAGNGDLGRGLLADAGVQVTGVGTPLNLGALTANQTLMAQLHVLSGAGSIVDAVVESDVVSGFTVPTTRLTMTQILNQGSDRKTVKGVISDTFFRFNFTVTGTVTILASLAIVS